MPLYAQAPVTVGGPFTRQGPLAVTTGVSRYYADAYYTVTSVRASVNTPPQGSTIIVDVLKNGTTMFTTTGNRPAIAIGGNTAVSAAPPDITSVAPGDYLTVNIVQAGSTQSGADLTVTIIGTPL